MSASKVMTMKITENSNTLAWIVGMSDRLMLSSAKEPTPLMANMDSTTTAPLRRWPNCTAVRLTTGRIATRRACLNSTRFGLAPLA